MGQGEPAGQVVGWSVSSWFVVVVVVAVCCLFYSSYIGTRHGIGPFLLVILFARETAGRVMISR